MTLLRDVIDIPEQVHAGDFVLKLTEGVEHADDTIREYVVTPDLARAFDLALGLVEAAVTSGGSRAAFLHGSFGSGKSHFMAVLHALLGGNPAARGIPELAAPIAKHDRALQGRRFLRLAYHLIGHDSLEHALFGGYLQQIARLHPDAPLPALHRTDGLFRDARLWREKLGEEEFFASLNGGSQQEGGDVWAAFVGRWDAARYDRAATAAPDDPERRKLAEALIRTFFPSFAESSDFVDIDTGLRVVAEHARDLGYAGVILFLDELVLWLAGHVANREWVNREGAKVAKLVESGDARRPIPLISFIARQRDLRDFLGQAAPGAHQEAISDTFRWWEDRFDRITLGDDNLPHIAHRRLLQPRDDAAREVLSRAFSDLDRRPDVWNTLLDGFNTDDRHRGADEAAFRLTYPFSPALVSTLRALSSLMQRERTALKVMQQILVDQRDELQVEDLVPVGDAFDYVVEGQQALDVAMERHFAAARRLHKEKIRPLLLTDNGVEADAAASQDRRSPFRVDDRLAKTLLLSALVPAVPALRDLDAGRLAALNHGTIASPLPGQEGTTVLARLRHWQPQIPEIQLAGDPRNPTATIQLAEVDYQSVLDRVRIEDNPGARRRLLKEMVWSSLGIKHDPNLFRVQGHAVVWRASRRIVELAYGNVREPSDVPDELLVHDGENWRVVVDYPFDEEEGRSPVDDLARLERLREGGGARTVAWLPRFLAPARLNEVGNLVQLDYLFSGDGARFDANADHLSTTDRAQARAILLTMRDSLRQRLGGVIQQAYGAAAPIPGDVEVAAGQDRVLDCLDRSVSIQEPVGATLEAAFANLGDQLLRHSYPAHPAFEPSSAELRPSELRRALQFVEQARQQPNGRVAVQDTTDRSVLRRVCNPLGLGQMHENAYVLDVGSSFPWRNRFTRQMGREGVSGAVTVEQLRRWIDAEEVMGLSPTVASLVIAAWAVVTDRGWYRYGGPIAPPALDQVSPDMELREQVLPQSDAWAEAGRRAGALLGAAPAAHLTAASLARFARDVRERAQVMLRPARELEQALGQHAEALGLDVSTAAGRLATARAATRMLEEALAAPDDTALVATLGAISLPAEEPVVARSLARAEAVTGAILGARWEMLAALRGIHDERAAEARDVLEALAAAACTDEFQKGLAEALDRAQARTAQILAGPAGSAVSSSGMVTPGADSAGVGDSPGAAANRGSVTVDAGRLDQVRAALDAFARAHPSARIRVTWRIEQ